MRRGDGATSIVVEDAGPGVPASLREAIFELFRQGGQGRGLGIGLSLVARFAALHGGLALVGESERGGACFEVVLPDGPAAGGPQPDARVSSETSTV